MKFTLEPTVEYRVTSVDLFQTEDVYNEGQIGEFQHTDVYWIKVASSEFLSDMVQAVEESFGPDAHVGIHETTITVNLLADEDGLEADKGQLDEWKKGNLKLWNQDFIFYVEKVIVDSEPDLQEILAEEAQI